MAKNRKKKVSSILRNLKLKARGKKTLVEKQKYVKKAAEKMKKNKTWPELEFEKLMDELGVEFEPQKVVGLKIFDYYIPSKNMVVEVDGDYFHGNPEKYDKPSKMQQRNRRNDKYKSVLALNHGFLIERVWESDLKNNYDAVKFKFSKLLLS